MNLDPQIWIEIEEAQKSRPIIASDKQRLTDLQGWVEFLKEEPDERNTINALLRVCTIGAEWLQDLKLGDIVREEMNE